MAKPLLPHQRHLVWAMVISILLLTNGPGRMLLLPITYLNTHLHELGHALAAWGTGGTPLHIKVFADGSGVTPVVGGFLPVVAASGYLGAAVLGGWIILASRREQGARRMMLILSGVLALSMVVLVRGDLVGILSGAFWVVALWAGSRSLRDDQAIFAGQFLGVQQGLAAFGSLVDLLWLSGYHTTPTDAKIMEKATGLPALLWALLWMVAATAITWLTLKRAWRARDV